MPNETPTYPPPKPLDQLMFELRERGPDAVIVNDQGRTRPLGMGDPLEHDVVFFQGDGAALACSGDLAPAAAKLGAWVGFVRRGEDRAHPMAEWSDNDEPS